MEAASQPAPELADGLHDFQVRTTDFVGNMDALHRGMVDLEG